MERGGDPVGKRQRASKRELPALRKGEGKLLCLGRWSEVHPSFADIPHWREASTNALRAELARAYELHGRGESWRVPFPQSERSDGDPVVLAFVAWASGIADDDMIAAILYPHEYRRACADIGEDDDAQRDDLIDRVRALRLKYKRLIGRLPIWEVR
jgi:hypothetical protein